MSICSEPTVAVRNLSCQSSIEPCVPEEDSPDVEDQFFPPENGKASSITGSTQVIIEPQHKPDSPISSRPDSLILNTTSIDNKVTNGTDNKHPKYLYRSYSTRSFKKSKPKPNKLLSNDLDRIFVISSHDDDYYDSIEVISERRSKNFSKFQNELENVEKIDENADKQAEDDVKIEIDPNQNKLESNWFAFPG